MNLNKENAVVVIDPMLALLSDPAPESDAEWELIAGSDKPDLIEIAGILELDATPEEIAQALNDAETASTRHAMYVNLEAEKPVVAPGDAPATPEDATPPEVAAVAPKKGRKKAEPKEKKAPVPTFYSHTKSAVLMHKLGGKLDVLNLELADFELDAAAQTAKQLDVLDLIDTKMAKKVSEKAVMLLNGMAATQKVINRTFTVLHRDGFLMSGDKGNLIVDLLATPYSIGTARSQSNQMFALLPLLKVVTKTTKGRFEVNPESTIFADVVAKLGLTVAAE